MRSQWNEAEASEYVSKYAPALGEDSALLSYVISLICGNEALGWHTGGSISLKSSYEDLSRKTVPILAFAASRGLFTKPERGDFQEIDLNYLGSLKALPDITDEMLRKDRRFGTFPGVSADFPPELPVHGFIDRRCIIHVHARVIRVLSSLPTGFGTIKSALGQGVIALDIPDCGLQLARISAAAVDSSPEASAMVWLKHGLVVWGDTARAAYELLIRMMCAAEEHLHGFPAATESAIEPAILDTAAQRFIRFAPTLRGLLAQPTNNPDRPRSSVVLHPLLDSQILSFVNSERGRDLALADLLTTDFAIGAGLPPLWIPNPQYEAADDLKRQVNQALIEYSLNFEAGAARSACGAASHTAKAAAIPPVIFFPGMGAVCIGSNVRIATLIGKMVADDVITKIEAAVAGSGPAISADAGIDSRGGRSSGWLPAEWRAKQPMEGQIALVTGAAGAIGAAISEELLQNGCNVAVTDLPGESLDSLCRELSCVYGPQVSGIPLDVTDPESVARGFETAARNWGGVDLLVINAGLAHVSSLATMNLDAFQKLARVNVEGTLLLLREAARYFRLQGTGGDVILISTKNVFAPGASFGAYSATKAASHQLARIASLELAEAGVRVNMVSPDAVFSHGNRRSGLWAEVGPDRMKARGLTQEGLEDYYRSRNLLKIRVTAKHVARAVLFFATRQTPTTGATLPVDGGLPDATPR